MMNTSLTFEVLLYLNSYYFGLFAVCEIGMNIVKYINFTNLEHFSTDFGVLMGVCAIELIRVVLARKGNLTERKWPIVIAIFLTIPSLAGVVYLMIWQSEVLRFEYIICAIQIGLQFIEIVTGIICLLPFSNERSIFEKTFSNFIASILPPLICFINVAKLENLSLTTKTTNE